MPRVNRNNKPKTKARMSILNEVINQKDWDSGICNPDVKQSDLVSLSSAPASQWYLSWVIETKNGAAFGSKKYLLESIEDGSLCWWENVRLNVYSRKRVEEWPSWRWSDDQFAFAERWTKVGKRNDAHIVLPAPPVFNSDGSVQLGVRVKSGMDDFSNRETFPNWKKLTMQRMSEYYLSSVEKRESNRKKAT